MLFKKFVRTAFCYKPQFFSMVVMIAIGIGIFLGFNMEWHSIESNTSAFFEATNYADYRIYAKAGFTPEILQKIRDIDGVEAATRYFSVNVGLKNSKKSVTLNVSENYKVSTALVTAGEAYNSNSDGIWLSDRFAEANGITLGQKITLTYQGVEISGRVAGLCKSGENMICVADSNQLMPDYNTHGFAYISPKKLQAALGQPFYAQINILSSLSKARLEAAVQEATGTALQITDKTLHTAYAGAQSEAEEGKTMGLVLPVLFLAIAVLTMVTTMHRIAANEKVQIGTLKALGFQNRRILRHYTSYGFFVGLMGLLLGVALGYGIVNLIMSPGGMMATYFDLPEWKHTVPAFCLPVLLAVLLFLTLISYLSTKKMLRGTAAESLRPYLPKTAKTARLEKTFLGQKLPFSVKWNLRDILRHKARSGMTLLGVFGCMLLIVGGLGMRDTMQEFLNGIDKTAQYATKVSVAETAQNAEALALCEMLNGDWQSTAGISYQGRTVTLDIYSTTNGQNRFFNEKNSEIELANNGVYLCLRLKDTAKIGETVSVLPYGSSETYRVQVAGYFRSAVSESIVMSEAYAKTVGIPYKITSVYTATPAEKIENTSVITGKQSKQAIMDSYDTFLELMDFMVLILIVAAAVLGIVVLYNLGVMSYVERKRELATLKVLGFQNKKISRLLISQNIWLTLLGALLGWPGGTAVLYILIRALCSEYELKLEITGWTYLLSTLLTFGVSLLVGLLVARKNKKIDMAEAMKATE